MSVITVPSAFKPRTCAFTQSANQRVNAAPFGGSEQAVDLLNDRWLVSLELRAQTLAEAATIEAFIAAMRGQTNTCALWHFMRAAPRGTMRGTLTMSATAAQGAASIIVTGGAGQAATTLLQGDLLGVGGLLLMVASDCTANGSGVITVPITNRLRTTQSSGAAVTWDKPTTSFRLLNTSGVHYVPGYAEPVSMDFGEAI